MARASDGTDDWRLINVGCTSLGTQAGPWTIAFWFKAANLTQVQKYPIHGYSNVTAYQWAILWEYVGNTVEFYASGQTGGGNPRLNSGLVIGDTNWHHIAYRKAASGASAWDKFLDGVKTQISASITFTLAVINRVSLFATATAAPANETACSLADVAIWHGALSDAEITALAVGAKPDAYPTNAVNYWKLTGASPEEDFVGSNDLTVSGTTYVDDPMFSRKWFFQNMIMR